MLLSVSANEFRMLKEVCLLRIILVQFSQIDGILFICSIYSYVFAGGLSRAVQHYRQALNIARETGDLATEAQASYSVGNCYTLMQEFSLANQFQARHFEITTRLKDKVQSPPA